MLNMIIGYLIMAYAFHFWLIYYKGAAHFTKNSDPALKKKYAPFMRNDMHSFTSIWVFI